MERVLLPALHMRIVVGVTQNFTCLKAKLKGESKNIFPDRKSVVIESELRMIADVESGLDRQLDKIE